VTTNLSQADMCVHDTGRLWKSVRASMTVLDYLPPLQMSTQWPDLLIDGQAKTANNTQRRSVCYG
jgi:predicted acylesterase/phospholipase RssA